MSNVTRETELAVRMPPEPAEIARLIATVGAAHIETLACCTYHDRDSAVMLLVTDDAAWADGALRAQNFRVTANEVVVVHAAYKPQLAVPLGRRLTEANIGVLYSYASSLEDQHSHIVFKTTDDDRAISLLRAEMLACTVAHEKTSRPNRILFNRQRPELGGNGCQDFDPEGNPVAVRLWRAHGCDLDCSGQRDM